VKTHTLALAFALTTAAAAQAAASPSAKLTYVRGPGAESCPDESELRKAVAVRLGYDPFFPSASKTVVAEIRARAAPQRGFRGVVQIIDDSGIVRGERALESQSGECAEMVRTLALGISIAIDDLDALAPPAPRAAPASSDPPPEPGLPVAPAATDLAPPPPFERDVPAPVLPSERATALQLETVAGVHGSLGLAPAASGGITLGVGITTRAVSLRIEGTAELPSSAPLASGGSVTTSFLVASLVPCLHFGLPFACVTGSVGSFRGGAIDIAAPHAQSALFAMVGARGGVRIPLYAMVSLAPHADLALPLVHHAVAVDGRTVFSTPAIGGALGLDVQAAFP
jgi:hypothetical protein